MFREDKPSMNLGADMGSVVAVDSSDLINCWVICISSEVHWESIHICAILPILPLFSGTASASMIFATQRGLAAMDLSVLLAGYSTVCCELRTMMVKVKDRLYMSAVLSHSRIYRSLQRLMMSP